MIQQLLPGTHYSLMLSESCPSKTNLESHSSEGDKQTSLYVKIAAFRWVNTAIVITIITPFTSTLAAENGLITQIAALYFAEIVTTNGIQLADPMGKCWPYLRSYFVGFVLWVLLMTLFCLFFPRSCQTSLPGTQGEDTRCDEFELRRRDSGTCGTVRFWLLI